MAKNRHYHQWLFYARHLAAIAVLSLWRGYLGSLTAGRTM